MGRRREGVFFTSSMPDKCLFRATGCLKESSARAAAFGFQNNPPPVSNRKHTRDAAGIRYVEEEEREVSLSRHSLSLSLLIHSSGVHFIVAHMCDACLRQKRSPSLQKALIREKWGGSRLEGGELAPTRHGEVAVYRRSASPASRNETTFGHRKTSSFRRRWSKRSLETTTCPPTF